MNTTALLVTVAVTTFWLVLAVLLLWRANARLTSVNQALVSANDKLRALLHSIAVENVHARQARGKTTPPVMEAPRASAPQTCA